MYFSIVIPLYNKEEHVRRAIDSILRQTHQEFEIVVVNDGSTDNSVEEVKKVQDSRMKIYTKSNAGVSSARNYGIQKSIYDYIAFLDADDAWKPQFLESITSIITKFPQGGAYATSYEFKKNDKTKFANINIDLDRDESSVIDYFKCALNDPVISASSVVIKKEVFSNIGMFSIKLTHGEDLEMWCRIALNYPIVFINTILVSYYTDSKNRSTQSEKVYNKTFMSYAESILEEQKKLDNTSFYFEEYMISRILSKVRYLVNNMQFKEARKVLFKYKYTKCNKKNWMKNYILTFKPLYTLYKKLR